MTHYISRIGFWLYRLILNVSPVAISSTNGDSWNMSILSQKLYHLGLIFAPLFYLRWLGKKTFVEQLTPKTRLKMRVNTFDRQAVHEVWRLKAYEDEHFTICARDVVIDIGAHIGAFSVRAATQANSGTVYAFEPNGENYGLLEENKLLNDLTNLHIFKLAVSNEAGEAVLFNSEYHNMTHSFFEDGVQNKTTIRTISLADILQTNDIERVNYLKIDAEGAEYLIVLNTPSNVLLKIDKIFIEYHDNLDHGHNFKELIRFLIGNGFQVETVGSAFSRHILKLGLLKARRIVPI